MPARDGCFAGEARTPPPPPTSIPYADSGAHRARSPRETHPPPMLTDAPAAEDESSYEVVWAPASAFVAKQASGSSRLGPVRDAKRARIPVGRDSR